jgi:hypothetical protein
MRTIMIDGGSKVACPKCSHHFGLSEGLSRETIERHAEEFERAFAEQKRALEQQLLAEAKRRVERELAAAKAAAKEELQTELRSLREAVTAKDGALEKSRNDELQLRRQLREAEDTRKNQEVELQRKLDEERRRIDAQYKVQLESAQREAADLKRKLESGAVQFQGEGLEVSLEALLRAAFPLDEIVPVPKGMNGADLLQRVRAPSGACCGTIIWEAKQTKAWQPLWLRKLKDDQQAVGAEAAVIVTASMPKDTREPFVRESDVWIARFDAARPLAEALRLALLELHKSRIANQGRSEKMERLYAYICSPQFTQRVKTVVEGFAVMRQELEQEKMAAARMFKKREMQLTRMTEGLLHVVGDLQGIGEASLAQLDSVAALPLPAEEELQDA